MTRHALLFAILLATPSAGAHGQGLPHGATAPNFTKDLLSGGSASLSQYAGQVVVLSFFGHNCPVCRAHAPAVEAEIHDHYAAHNPGEVQVLGVDLWNGTPAQVTSYRNATGVTFPLMMRGAIATGGNVQTLYNNGVNNAQDDLLVVNKHGILRYHASLSHSHGARYNMTELRTCIDSLVAPAVGVGGAGAARFALGAAPNPAAGAAVIRFANPGPGAVEVEIAIHDVGGRRVAAVWRGPAAPGDTRLTWDGRGDDGAPAPAGLYFVTARFGDRVLHSRLTRLR